MKTARIIGRTEKYRKTDYKNENKDKKTGRNLKVK